MSTYVVVTVFDPADGKRRIVHTWGPHSSRKEALAAIRRMKQQDKRLYEAEDRPGVLTYHAREVMGEEPS